MIKNIEPYKILVDFLADYLGETAEVILYDVSHPIQSVVAIRNGSISNLKIGDPIGESVLKRLENKEEVVPYYVNYKGIAANGHLLRSATYFIKDDTQNCIGLLCINTDCEKYRAARDLLETMITANPISQCEDVSDGIDAKALVKTNIARVMPKGQGDLKAISKPEKTAIVERLEAMGTFKVKGSILHVAKTLGVSVPTVYRYLSMAKKDV